MVSDSTLKDLIRSTTVDTKLNSVHSCTTVLLWVIILFLVLCKLPYKRWLTQHVDLLMLTLCFHILCINRAFDTLAKVLHPGDGPARDSLEATMQLMSGDQSGPVVELEGPILSDSHIPFKVSAQPLTSMLRIKSNRAQNPLLNFLLIYSLH